MKIVINSCYGGFGLSDDAIAGYMAAKNLSVEPDQYSIDRADQDLVRIVEKLGSLSNGNNAELSIVEIPNDVKWQIEEYDGKEWVSELHRIWGA